MIIQWNKIMNVSSSCDGAPGHGDMGKKEASSPP